MQLLTLGVEEEFQVVDLTTDRPTCGAADLAALAAPVLGERVTTEFNLCQIETRSDVWTTLEDLRADLAAARCELARAGRDAGLGIASVGTHPNGDWRRGAINGSSERYRRLADQYQVVAKEQIICGCHVHVGIPDDDLRIRALDGVRPWLHVLMALSVNSPWWEGADSGYESYRHQVWRRWPTAGVPPVLGSAAAYRSTMDELVATGVLKNPSDLYWYARPSARFPTLEFRACDAFLDVDDTVAVAGLSRALAWTAARDGMVAVAPERFGDAVLDAALFRAARYGLTDRLLCPVSATLRPASEVVGRLLLAVADGLECHGDDEQVRTRVARVLAKGTGAARQRRLVRRGDVHRLLEVPTDDVMTAA